MKRKNIYTAVLATAFICILTSCSQDEKADNTSQEESSEVTVTESVNEPEADAEKVNEYLAADADALYWNHHENMWCLLYKYVNEEKQSPMRFYQDDRSYIWIFEDGRVTYGSHDSYIYIIPDGDNITYRADLTDRDELYETWYKNIHTRNYVVVNDSFILLETSEKEDGTFEVLYEIRDPEACRQLVESEAPDLPEDFVYEDGTCFRYLYRFDIKTKDLLGYFHYSVNADGSVRTLAEAEFLYDTDKYDPFAEGEPIFEYRSMQEDPEKSRKITITFDPDTEYEKTRETVIPQIAGFGIYYRDDVPVEDLYTDRECTVPYTEDMDNGSDLDLFARDKSAKA